MFTVGDALVIIAGMFFIMWLLKHVWPSIFGDWTETAGRIIAASERAKQAEERAKKDPHP